jgi:molybdenum cofactor cytidylyltransferase
MRIAGLVLAAGRSSRMGPRNKLLEPVGGETIVRRVAATAIASGAEPVIVVTGHEAASVAGALHRLDVTIVANPDYADGLSTSLRIGLRALRADPPRRHA